MLQNNPNVLFQLPCEVKKEDVLPPYHHVHHANILKYMEKARVGLMRVAGCPLEGYLEKGLFLVISQIQISYKREVKVGTITVSCEEVNIDGKKVQIKQRVINERGKLAVDAVVESQFLSGALGRAIKPPEDFRSALLSLADRLD